MLATLLSFLGGSAFRMLWGEISSAWTKHQDHAHELSLLELQVRADAARHVQTLESLRVQSELGVRTIAVQADADVSRAEADAFTRAVDITGRQIGVRWVDAWNGAIRPALATACILLWLLHGWRNGFVLDEQGWGLLAAVVGVYIADRSLAKRGK